MVGLRAIDLRPGGVGDSHKCLRTKYETQQQDADWSGFGFQKFRNGLNVVHINALPDENAQN